MNTLGKAQGISVSPSRIFFKGEPGQTVTHPITFSNQSSSTFTFVTRIMDWDRDSLGVKIYYPAGTKQSSNAAWLNLSDPSLNLAPGETKQVNLTMTIPNKNGSDSLSNSMLFFTQLKNRRDSISEGLGINILLEMGIQVYHIPAGLSPGELDIVDFQDKGQINIQKKSVRQLAVKIKNSGSLNRDGNIRFELTNIQTGEEIPVQSIALAMLPFSQQWVIFNLPSDLKGRYLAVAILEGGQQYDLKVAEKEITY